MALSRSARRLIGTAPSSLIHANIELPDSIGPVPDRSGSSMCRVVSLAYLLATSIVSDHITCALHVPAW